MKRRDVLLAAALTLLGYALPRFSRAQPGGLSRDSLELVAAIGDVVLPSTLGAEGRAKAVGAFVRWLDEYKAGVPMSYGYGSQLPSAVVPPSPLLRYPSQFKRLQELSGSHGAKFLALSPADRKSVVEAALVEAKVDKLPDRPDGEHIASDLLSHFYASSDGNDFLYNASIRVSYCRGLGSSSDRPVSLT